MKNESVVIVRKIPKIGACSARGPYARLLAGGIRSVRESRRKEENG